MLATAWVALTYRLTKSIKCVLFYGGGGEENVWHILCNSPVVSWGHLSCSCVCCKLQKKFLNHPTLSSSCVICLFSFCFVAKFSERQRHHRCALSTREDGETSCCCQRSPWLGLLWAACTGINYNLMDLCVFLAIRLMLWISLIILVASRFLEIK